MPGLQAASLMQHTPQGKPPTTSKTQSTSDKATSHEGGSAISTRHMPHVHRVDSVNYALHGMTHACLTRMIDRQSVTMLRTRRAAGPALGRVVGGSPFATINIATTYHVVS